MSKINPEEQHGYNGMYFRDKRPLFIEILRFSDRRILEDVQMLLPPE